MPRGVIGIEIVPEAIDNAKANAQRNGIDRAQFLGRRDGNAPPPPR